MHKEDIKASLRKAGSSSAEIAYRCGVSRSYVSLVISGKRASSVVASHVALVLGKRASLIWPGRYVELDKRAA